MAYVGISKDLIERVEQKINSMRAAEVRSVSAGGSRQSAKDASELYTQLVWGKSNAHLAKVIPKDWLRQMKDVAITVEGPHFIGDQSYKVSAAISFNNLSNAYSRPCHDSYYGIRCATIKLEDLQAMPDTTVGKAELLEAFQECCLEAEINLKWAKINNDVCAFLRKCKSLNEAVKLFPNVKLYVSSDDIYRLEKKVERAPRQELAKDVDTDGITAAAVAAKLMAAV